ncbi:hypothetical protein [Ascidiaceihabitans sp.]|uniref:hypothetical protein n=1 Tax=Ascidiaceihabitans sp. TaxID=1872644 RepID=UPI0032989BDE
MTLKIGKAEFDVQPLIAQPALDNVADYLDRNQFSQSKVFWWNCRMQRGSDADGQLTIELDCLISFPVLAPRSTTKIDKPKSVALRKAMQAHTGLKRKDMLAAIRKAVQPVRVDLDARPAVKRLGERFSFDINLSVIFRFFTMTPTKNAALGSVVIGVPVANLFSVKKTSMCGKGVQMGDYFNDWADGLHNTEQHKGWFESEAEHVDAANERLKKREAERNAKKGIRIKPRDG